MAIVVRELLIRLGIKADAGSFNKAERGVKELKGALNRTARAADAVRQNVVGMVAGFFALDKLVSAGRGIFDANVEFERLSASLLTVTGSTEAATEAFEKISEFTADTPFQLAQVADAFILLSNLGLDPSERALASYGNTASSLGKSLDDMVQAVADATTGEFERLKEFGILAKSEGKNVEFTFNNVTTTVGKNAKEIEEFLIGIGETRFAGAMENQMNTLGGLVSNLKDQFFLFALEIGAGGLRDALRGLLRLLIQNTEAVKDLARDIGKVLAVAVRALSFALQVVAENTEAAKEVLIIFSAIVGVLARRLVLAAIAALAIPLIIFAISVLIQDLIVFLQGGESAVGDLLESFGAADTVRGVFEGIVSAVLGVVDAILPLALEVLPLVIEAFFEVVDVIRNDVLPVVIEFVTAWIGRVVRLIGIIINDLLPVIFMIATAIFDIVRRILPVIFSVIGRIQDVILDVLPAVIGLVSILVEIVIEVVDIILDIAITLIDAIADIIVALLPFVIQLLGVVVDTIKTISDRVLPILKRLIGAVVVLIEALLPLIIAIIEAVMPVVIEVLEFIIELLVDFLLLILPLIEFAIDVIVDIIVPIVIFIAEATALVIDGIALAVDIITELWEGLGEVFESVWGGLETAVGAAVAAAMILLQPLIDTLNLISDAIDEVAGDAAGEATSGIDASSQAIMALGGSVAQSMAISATAVGTRTRGGGVTNNTTVGDLNVEVVATEGMNERELAVETGREVKNALSRELRQTSRDFEEVEP